MKNGGTQARIGVLALQGDYALHLKSLAGLGVTGVEVRQTQELADLDGLILPGGESTTMLKLMEGTTFEENLRAFHARGGALFGTCAGLILLAHEITHSVQRSLGILDVDVSRNGYGRQTDSFETDLTLDGDLTPFRAVFIRAPRFSRMGQGVQVLAIHDGEPVAVQEGRVMAVTFHPEATPDLRFHERFVELCKTGVVSV